MEYSGTVVAVTGAGSGIGAALCRRFAARGAHVVAADLDAEAVRAVAGEVGGQAVPGDAASEEGVARIVETARAAYGEIDLYCANAGVADGGGPEASDESWDRSWEVNVMAHVRAARALLPGWLERGRGHFVSTVSAAGLLTMLGAAPYSVTKHGAVAFAEWLSITYGDRGVTVQTVCPQGVRTAMLDDADSVGRALLAEDALEPGQVADAVLEGIDDGRFLILPHPEVAGYYSSRASDPDRWLRGMRKLERRVSGE